MKNTLVLGLGGTVDYEIAWDSTVIEELISEFAISSAELSTSITIGSERDLLLTLLAFLQDGVGGERFVASSDIVESFAARFGRRLTLGGTCVRAAIAMQAVGVPSTLHLVSIDDTVRRLLPAGVDYICSATDDSTDPHLIVQFREGERITRGDIDLQAPHSNRVIYTNDPPNRELLLSEELGAVLADAEVFMISGFNSIQEPEVMEQRLESLKTHMKQLPASAVVFYEDAGFHVPVLSQQVRNALVGEVDVYSMNEDEMQAYVGRSLDLLDAGDMCAALAELHRAIPAATLVVHTKYWSLAYGQRASSFEAGLRGGITMASTRYVHGDGFDETDYDAVANLGANQAGADFAETINNKLGELVHCLPALALEVEHPTTIGLGDTFVGGFVAALHRS
ncbi:ADP-dependent glucokinase/phosphofructokinase [Arthrobacter sp. HY1533]|uniref:ADP-dependent glucokinase/phosphofructokinase n=1 Tax=Arthrobacter sp. HY1533 TaxID=2970919 RepID=UPI0022B9FDA1|nr:ADP-dependent glucokinase/phosphofructokinase [Arthrobacter sp. HY1533]